MKNALKVLFLLILSVQACKKKQPAEPIPTDPGSNAKWVLYNSSNSALSNNQVNAIAIDKKDVKWIGTASGLVRIAGVTWTVFDRFNSPLPSSFIRALAAESDGTLWIGTDSGLARFADNQWSVYTVDNSALESNSITCITYDAKNKITYVATEEGLIKVSQQNTWDFIYVNDLILSIATDTDGNLWAGMFNPFAFVGKIKKYEYGHWKTHLLPDLGYASALPYSLGADEQNNVYAVLSGTATSCVVRFKDNVWNEMEKPEKAKGLKAILIQGNTLWVGGNSLSRFGSKQSPVLNIPGADSNILSMALDSKGRKWLGTLNNGVAVYQE